MNAKTEPLPDLIEESFQEAAFLWSRWEAELVSISRNLEEVWSWTEDRLGGALDGVQLAPAATLERLAGIALAGDKRAEHTVCGRVLASAAAPIARALLGDAIRGAQGPRLRSLMRGVEVADLDGSFAPVTKILSHQSAEHAASLARLKAFRRASLGEELTLAFESKVTDLQIEALRAARQLPPQYAASWIDTGLKHEHSQVRMAAMESGIRQRIPNAWGAALSAARGFGGESAGLLRLLAMLGSESEHAIIFSALSKPTLQRSALWALGNVGSREAAEHCLIAMKHANLARMAGEAYCAITGADWVRDRLSKPEPDVPTPDFASDDLDANLVPTQEAQWPLPDLTAVRKHWNAIEARYQRGVRHVRGRPVSVDVLMDAVEEGPMLRRPDYAYELYVRTHGKYDVETRATRQVQRHMMLTGRARIAAPPAN
jgi:uncharacterized protein (TIGR02270 family)